MYELRWFIQVRNLTRVSALNKKKTVVLPSPSDIGNITSYVKTTLSGMTLTLTLTEAGLFKETAMLVQSRLVLYNKRCPGDIEGISNYKLYSRMCPVKSTCKNDLSVLFF